MFHFIVLFFFLFFEGACWGQEAVPAPPNQNANLKIGMIGNFIGHAGTNIPDPGNKFDFSEGELNLQAAIDPYANGTFVVTFPSQGSVGIEEAYLTTTALPWTLQAKVGKFHTHFGKLNKMHRDAFPFIDLPLMLSHLFNGDQWSDTGGSLSGLIPNRWDHFLELDLQVLNGNVGSSFNNGQTRDLAYLAHLDSFHELNENSALDWGLSGANGVNDPAGQFRTVLEGLDITYKWKRPVTGTYRSFGWITEFFGSQKGTGSTVVYSKGLYSFAEYQFAQRWSAGGRYDYAEQIDDNNQFETAESAIVTFKPSEFQSLRAQYKHTFRSNSLPGDEVLFQWLFLIGAHPAHAY
ncbi:MAG TPA: TonB-dependent receptor [Nitrospiria bacterium]|nr:TonB-dependent receptor [Nitrospiria bacterium]